MKRAHNFPLVMGLSSLSVFSIFSLFLMGTGSVGCGVKVETPNQIDQYLQGQWVAERLTSDGTHVVLGFQMNEQGVRQVGVSSLTTTGQMTELSRGTYSLRSSNNVSFDFDTINDFQAVYSFLDTSRTRLSIGSDTYTKASSEGWDGPILGGQVVIEDALGDISVGVGALSLSDTPASSTTPEPAVIPDVIVKMRDGSVRRVMIQPQVPAAAALSLSDTTSIVGQLDQQEAQNRQVTESIYHSIEELKADPNVLSVTPNIMLQTQSISAPTDSLFGDEWNLRILNVLDAWAQLGDVSAGRDVVVAVIDTGIVTTPRAADFGDRVLYDLGYDFVDDVYWSSRENCNSNPSTYAWRDFDLDGNGPDGDPTDPGQAEFHGTHVAGIIAAGLDNGGIVGIAGAATHVKVLPLRSMGKCGGGNLFDNAEAIKYAAKILPNMGDCSFTVRRNDTTTPPSLETVVDAACTTAERTRNPSAFALRPKADVINLSLGQFMRTDDYNNVLGSAIRQANQQGVLVVAAAGNTQGGGKGPGWCPNPTTGVLERNATCNFYPASDSVNVLSVGAVYPNLSFATDYSNYSSQSVQPHYLVAPGGSNNDGIKSLTRVDDPDGSSGYKELIGTSQAAPHVAGVAAMMMSVANRTLSPTEVRTMLENTAIPMSTNTTSPYWDDHFGTGLLNPVGAIIAAKGSATGVARLSLSSSQLVFGYTGTTAMVLATSSNGNPLSGINATATTSSVGNWLRVTTSSVSTPARLDITVSRTGLADGNYSGLVTVNSSAGTQTINVSMSVSSTQTTGDSLTNLRNAIERLTGVSNSANSQDIGTVIVSLVDPVTDQEVYYTTTDFAADYKFLMGVQPGEYYLKAVADVNNNHEIDVGEPVFAYPNAAGPQVLTINPGYNNTRLTLRQ